MLSASGWLHSTEMLLVSYFLLGHFCWSNLDSTIKRKEDNILQIQCRKYNLYSDDIMTYIKINTYVVPKLSTCTVYKWRCTNYQHFHVDSWCTSLLTVLHQLSTYAPLIVVDSWCCTVYKRCMLIVGAQQIYCV